MTPQTNHQTIITQIVTDLITFGDIPSTASNLVALQPHTAHFYLLPKILLIKNVYKNELPSLMGWYPSINQYVHAGIIIFKHYLKSEFSGSIVCLS